MRASCRGYYRPTKVEFRRLNRAAQVTVDANVLLNLYRYSPTTRSEYLALLENVKSRLWLSHQAALEFHRNRLKVMRDHLRSFEDAQASIDKMKRDIAGLYRQLSKQSETEISELDKAWAALLKHVKEQADAGIQATNDPDEDEVLSRVTAIFEGRVGEPMSNEGLAATFEQGAKRFDQRIPPGFSDAKKPEPERYGDLVLWRQILAKATADKTDVILVTADEKEDWWTTLDGRAIGPHPALIEEFAKETGKAIYIYRPDAFAEQMGQVLKTTTSKSSLDEIRSTSARQMRRDVDSTQSHGVSDDALARLNGARRRVLRLTSEVERLESAVAHEPEASTAGELNERLGEMRIRLRGAQIDEAALSEYLHRRRQTDGSILLDPRGDSRFAAGSNTSRRLYVSDSWLNSPAQDVWRVSPPKFHVASPSRAFYLDDDVGTGELVESPSELSNDESTE